MRIAVDIPSRVGFGEPTTSGPKVTGRAEPIKRVIQTLSAAQEMALRTARLAFSINTTILCTMARSFPAVISKGNGWIKDGIPPRKVVSMGAGGNFSRISRARFRTQEPQPRCRCQARRPCASRNFEVSGSPPPVTAHPARFSQQAGHSTSWANRIHPNPLPGRGDPPRPDNAG